ncbi:AAA family ATPase [Botrimarina sp.]|uniref:AAA family ATPase n=1 Tax=Botrimarina sp. TaxID=2795802 RepID=UPI0032EB59C3
MSITQTGRRAGIELAELGYRVTIAHGLTGGGCTCSKGAACTSPGKHPRHSAWQQEATHDPATVEGWFNRWPNSGVGIVLGESVDGSRGVCDVEFDGAEGEATAREKINGTATPTWCSGRGEHRLFELPPNPPAKAKHEAAGLEFRLGCGGQGAQSIVPPTPHHSGLVRRWGDGLSPWQVEPAKFPPALQRLLGGEKSTPGDVLTMGHGMPFAEHPGAEEGSRRSALCALVGYHLRTFGPDHGLPALALEWAKRCRPEFPESEVVEVVADLMQRHHADPKAAAKAGARLIARSFGSMTAKPIEWLWQDRLPLGKFGLLAGDPGNGKTMMTCDLMARATTGEAFPDGSRLMQGEAAILSAEDDPEDTLLPRLLAAGADADRVHCIEPLYRDGTGKEQVLALEEQAPLIARFFSEHPELRLFVVDPLDAFCGEVDGHKGGEVRRMLAPLTKLIAEHRVCLLGIKHLSKRDGSSLNRIGGSIAFVAAARVAWRLGPDPDEPRRRLVLPVKCNIANPNGMAFSLEGEPPSLVWESEPVFVSADELDEADDTPRDEAERWLRGKLSDGPAKAAGILKAAKADGISERTLRRAKKSLFIASDRVGGEWLWSLPDPVDTPASDDTEADPGLYVVG